MLNPSILVIVVRLRVMIPSFVELRLIEDDEFPSYPPPGYVTLYPAMFRIGIRVPFKPPVHDWISELRVAPAQINPNGYRVILSFIVLWREKFNCDPPLDILRHSLILMRNSSSVNEPIKGFFRISSQRQCSLIGFPSWKLLRLQSLTGVVKEQFDTLLALPIEEHHSKSILTEEKLEIFGIATPARNMTLDKNDPILRARILQQRQAIRGPMAPKFLVLGIEATRLPDYSSPRERFRRSRKDSPPSPRKASSNSSYVDDFEKVSGKKKMSEGNQNDRIPLRKRLKADDNHEDFMADARKGSGQVKLKSRAEFLLVKHGQLEVPEFLSDYIEDILGFVDLKAHGNFAEGELEGDLDALVKGVKRSMMLKHIVINIMAERIKELDFVVVVTEKELGALKDQLIVRKKDLVMERQNFAECRRKLEGKEDEISQLGNRIKELEKDLEARTKELQREGKKNKTLDIEVEELKAKVQTNRSSILREFQNSLVYKDVLGVNYSEGYTNMLNMCIDHFGAEEMEWAIHSEGDSISKEKGILSEHRSTSEASVVVQSSPEDELQVAQGSDLVIGVERIGALEDDFQEEAFMVADQVSILDGEGKAGKVTP
ncbi:hypothetical protein M0R45_006289 [Rubus argutus]|uniref:Uncharacterized protein n=1 Tax=Rubus argutus TaxID=59490 RepID=A0AAW1YQ17_RUBAR